MIDLIQDFLDYCNYKNLSVKTIKSYNQTLVLFMWYLEEEKGITDTNSKTLSNLNSQVKFNLKIN
jgi:integrase/recombinase XerD